MIVTRVAKDVCIKRIPFSGFRLQHVLRDSISTKISICGLAPLPSSSLLSGCCCLFVLEKMLGPQTMLLLHCLLLFLIGMATHRRNSVFFKNKCVYNILVFENTLSFITSFFFCGLSLSFTWRTRMVESACVLLFPCFPSYWWVRFPRSVPLIESFRIHSYTNQHSCFPHLPSPCHSPQWGESLKPRPLSLYCHGHHWLIFFFFKETEIKITSSRGNKSRYLPHARWELL